MTEQPDTQMSHDMAQAIQILDAAHDMYQEILRASLDHAGHDDLDIPAFLKRLNGALVGFKTYDTQIAGLLERYQR